MNDETVELAQPTSATLALYDDDGNGLELDSQGRVWRIKSGGSRRRQRLWTRPCREIAAVALAAVNRIYGQP